MIVFLLEVESPINNQGRKLNKKKNCEGSLKKIIVTVEIKREQ